MTSRRKLALVSTCASLFLGVAAVGPTPTSAFQRGGGPRPVETSTDPSFSPEQFPKLAVIAIDDAQRPQGAGPKAGQTDRQRLVEDQFARILLGKGYKVVTRSDMPAVKKEQKFQRESRMTEKEAAARYGRVLNVPAVLVVRVTEVSMSGTPAKKGRPAVLTARASMGARLVGVETGTFLWIGTQELEGPVQDRDDTTLAVKAVANSLASAFPDRKSP